MSAAAPSSDERPADTPPVAPASPGEKEAQDAASLRAHAGDGFDANTAARRAIAALFACHSGALDALDTAARTRCEATRLTQARTAPSIDGVPADKRAHYDAVAAKIEEARALPASAGRLQLRRSPGLDVTAGFGCNIRFGPGATRANRQAHIRLGLPPCPLHLPLSPLTAETRVPTATRCGTGRGTPAPQPGSTRRSDEQADLSRS